MPKFTPNFIPTFLPKKAQAPQTSAGFTLIEVLVTVVVLSIGLLGLAGLQISGLRANMGSEARSKATFLANDIAERMRANTLGVHNDNEDDDNQYAGISTDNQDCGTLPAKFCSNFNDGAASNADDCTPAEMATFDAWVWACGMPKAAGVVPGGVTNILPGGTGTVTCNDLDAGVDADDCTPGSTHTITVSWDTPNPNRSGTNNEASTLNRTYTLVVVP